MYKIIVAYQLFKIFENDSYNKVAKKIALHPSSCTFYHDYVLTKEL